MPSIRLEFTVDAPSAAVWSAFRRVDQVHTDLAPGFVTDCVMRGDERLITFANGLVARELIVDVMPPEAEWLVKAMMEQGAAAMKRTLGCRAPGRE